MLIAILIDYERMSLHGAWKRGDGFRIKIIRIA